MKTPEEVGAIMTLHKLGKGVKSIAKEMGISKNTVKRYLAAEGQIEYRTPEREGILDTHVEWVKARYVQHRYNAEVVRQELATEKGIAVSLRTVERAVMPYRALARAEAEATTRFETKPGEQGQIDFGERFVKIDGVLTKVYFFVMTLGFSRRLYVRAFLDEKRDSWFSGMESAFLHFGGITETILMDNARVLVKSHDAATRTVVFSESFLAFSRHWGFIPRACAPYRARTKGKDESGVKYVKRNAIAGREFASWEELEAHLERWMRDIADVRIHGTTNEQPIARFERERNALRPLASKPSFIQGRDLQRKVHTDLCVEVDTNSYSVPWRFIGSEVSVSVKKGMVTISYAGQEIAHHEESKSRHQRIVDSKHFLGIVLPGVPKCVAGDLARPLAEYEAAAGGEG